MKRYSIIVLIIIVYLFACANNDKRLSEFIDIDIIKKASIKNNYGSFELDSSQILKLKKDLKELTFEEGLSIKTGAINISITIDNIEYYISGSTLGDYVEISEFGAFETNGVNFDNYKPH